MKCLSLFAVILNVLAIVFFFTGKVKLSKILFALSVICFTSVLIL